MSAPFRLFIGDAIEQLRTLPDESVQCVFTSPPYWALRDYGVEGQLGLERTPQEFVSSLVAVFDEVRRVLRSDGVCWVNIADTYASSGFGGGVGSNSKLNSIKSHLAARKASAIVKSRVVGGLKEKDLALIPARFALAMQSAGWWVRGDNIWQKPNAMPESVLDRPSRDHEHVFLFTKSERYFYDVDATRRPLAAKTLTTYTSGPRTSSGSDALGRVASANWVGVVRKPKLGADGKPLGAAMRSVWSVASRPFKGAHFATFPEELPRRGIVSGSRQGNVVLDPFAGVCTTGLVALKEHRRFIGIELNPEYARMGRERIARALPNLSLIPEAA